MEERKFEGVVNNSLILKPIYNIDLFEDIPREKNINSKNIYLKFYNEHTKKRVLENKNNSIINNPYYEQNMNYIKQKQIKNQIKKEEEKKIKSKEKKERSLEYRQKRMNKLYSSKNFLNNNNNNIILDKSKVIKNTKNNKVKRNSSLPKKYNKPEINNISLLNKRKDNNINYKRKMKINLSFDDKKYIEKNLNKKDINLTQVSKNVIVMTQHKYHKKIKTMIKLRKIYEDELNLIKSNTAKNVEKENNLNLLLNSINDEINRYKNKIDILIIE